MDLIVFDLDGTLLNRHSVISTYTRETLQLLAQHGIAYTVATGRTLHASREVLSGQGFDLPHVYKNGVVIWHPQAARFSHRNVLTADELRHVSQACENLGMTPFVFTIEGEHDNAVYHPPLKTRAEKNLKALFLDRPGVKASPIETLPAAAEIANISAVGPRESIRQLTEVVADEAHLVAYSGAALEERDLYWIDIHHSDASKGGAVEVLREMLGVKRVICFGDSDNDLSMFGSADECYAPANARAHVQEAATAVIGHHDEDGIAEFLRERFGLPTG